jgi:hypothetical protein
MAVLADFFWVGEWGEGGYGADSNGNRKEVFFTIRVP